jgi:hypothetical protein
MIRKSALAVVIAGSLFGAPAMAALPAPDAPYSPFIRHGDEYRTGTSTCDATIGTGHTLTLACAAGQTATVTYALKRDHNAPVVFRMSGDGIRSAVARARDSRWYVTIKVGEGTTTISAIVSYRGDA